MTFNKIHFLKVNDVIQFKIMSIQSEYQKYPELMKALDLFMSNDLKSEENLWKLFEETEQQAQLNKVTKGQYQHQKPRMPQNKS